MLNCIFQSFAAQNVHVQVLTTFHTDFRLYVYRYFTVFDFTQFADSNDFISIETCFRNDAALVIWIPVII